MAPASAGRHPGTPGPARGPAPAGLIWTRPPKEKRERPARDAIVAAATGLAGTRGLDAVSVRRVAAALQTRPMDLYGYFTRKDELIDLMVDGDRHLHPGQLGLHVRPGRRHRAVMQVLVIAVQNAVGYQDLGTATAGGHLLPLDRRLVRHRRLRRHLRRPAHRQPGP